MRSIMGDDRRKESVGKTRSEWEGVYKGGMEAILEDEGVVWRMFWK